MKNRGSEFEKFDAIMRELVKVSHDEIKAKLHAEKHTKQKPPKKRASVRASRAKDS
jgi:hypothetical protein